MFKPAIGLEIHIQLRTKSKMFCGCDNNAEGRAPNTVVCPICMGMPGTLPFPNKQAIEWTVKLGHFLHGKVAPFSKFDRKHYFYPDLPKGYQISQYDLPIVTGGFVEIDDRKIHLKRIHLEEDAGKLVHPAGKNYSLVDLNRAGTPLLEVVTEPEIKSAAEAKEFLQRTRLIVRYLGISDADMEKGHLRCDANVSLSQNSNLKTQKLKLGTPVEIKNLNSFLMVEKALTYEMKRQEKLLAEGKKVSKETRGFNDRQAVTVAQRSKEHAPDYRYFPEPDIPPMQGLDKLKIELPETIVRKIERFKKMGLKTSDISVLTSDENLLRLADDIVGCEANPHILIRALNLAINIELLRQMSKDFIVELAKALEDGIIGQPAILPIIKLGFEKQISVKDAIQAGGFRQISDAGDLGIIVKKIIDRNPKAVLDYKKGKTQAFEYLLGQAMREALGKASPQSVRQILKRELNG